MLDILGPKVAIVCEPEFIQLNNKKYNTADIAPGTKTCLILLDVPFQARIAQTIFDSEFKKYADTASRFYVNLRKYNGSVFIDPEPLQDSEFKELKKRVDSTRIFMSPGREINGLITSGWGLPSLSEYNGVYFYGHAVSSLSCDEAISTLQYGNKTYELRPTRKFKMNNLSNFRFIDQPVISPISHNPPEGFSTKFKGAAIFL